MAATEIRNSGVGKRGSAWQAMNAEVKERISGGKSLQLHVVNEDFKNLRREVVEGKMKRVASIAVQSWARCKFI